MTAFRRRRQSHQRDRRTSYCRGLSQHLPLFQQCCEDQSRSVAKSLATAETTITHIFNIYIDNSTNCTVTQLQLTTTPIYSFFSRTTRVSRCQEGKTSVHLNEARDDGVLGWQRHQLDHMQTVCTYIQPDNQTNTSQLNFYSPDALPDS